MFLVIQFIEVLQLKFQFIFVVYYRYHCKAHFTQWSAIKTLFKHVTCQCLPPERNPKSPQKPALQIKSCSQAVRQLRFCATLFSTTDRATSRVQETHTSLPDTPKPGRVTHESTSSTAIRFHQKCTYTLRHSCSP